MKPIHKYILVSVALVIQGVGVYGNDHFNKDDLPVDKIETLELLGRVPALQPIHNERPFMPKPLQMVYDSLVQGLCEHYESFTEQQKKLLLNEEKLTVRILSSKRNIRAYHLIKSKFDAAIKYLVYEKNWKGNGFVYLINAAPDNRGGQMAYLLHVSSGIILETKVSTSWKGIGYNCDSGKTPLGYFLLRPEMPKTNKWYAKTILTDIEDIFCKIEKQSKKGTAKWLKRVNTKKEKAYILSNQLALEGQNNGKEYVPISAPLYFHHKDSSVYWMDNANSLERHLYVHGTNRIEQLGYALSGGCIRVSNLYSYILKDIVVRQKVLPVFIDAIPTRKAVIGHYAPKLDRSDIEPTLDFEQNLSLLYGSIFNDSSSLVLKNRIRNELIRPLAKVLVNDSQVKVKIKLATAVPLPEKALMEWREIADTLAYMNEIKYRNTFDIQGNYYGSAEVKDLAVLRKYSAYDASYFAKNRLVLTKQFMENEIKDALSQYEIDYETFRKQIEIELPEFINLGEDIESTQFEANASVLSVSPQRKLVLKYYHYLDSLSSAAPEAFQRQELKWISSYPTERVQQKVLESGKDIVEITINHAILAQAYIYATGELALKKKAVRLGVMKRTDDEAGFLRFLGGERNEIFYSRLDEAGSNELYSFSYTTSKLTSKLTEGMKQNSERIFGIILFAEEYFSKYKKYENRLDVTVEVALNNNLISD